MWIRSLEFLGREEILEFVKYVSSAVDDQDYGFEIWMLPDDQDLSGVFS